MNYSLIITGKSSHPTLHHVFESTSNTMALEYAVRQSKLIASPKYWEFVLFRTEGEDQEVLRAWDVHLHEVVKLTPAKKD
jgi:hypothetical protein